MGPAPAPRINVLLVLPTNATPPVPVILAINFCGNHAVTDDPRVPLPTGFVYPKCKGVENAHATEVGRNAGTEAWPKHVYPLTLLLSRGYAFATFSGGDVDPDQPEIHEGVYAWLSSPEHATATRAKQGGSLSAWAFGFHRVVDALLTIPEIDGQRIAILGHSRQGKAALWAAATDERIALLIAHQAGMGGTAPNRGTQGETPTILTRKYPYWFSPRYAELGTDPVQMAYDQNALVALCAPRPVLLSNGEADLAMNPPGQFGVLRNPEAIYRLHGVVGLGRASAPVSGAVVGDRLGYFLRPGGHRLLPVDFMAFLDFADRHFRPATR